jgi:hypothetical protein
VSDEREPDWWRTQPTRDDEGTRPSTHPATWPNGPFLTAEALSEGASASPKRQAAAAVKEREEPAEPERYQALGADHTDDRADGHQADETPQEQHGPSVGPVAPQYQGTGVPLGPAGQPLTPDQIEAEERSWLETVRRRAAAMRRSEKYRERRILAAKYGVGAAIGWAFHLVTPTPDRGWAEQILYNVHTDPGSAAFPLCAAVGAYTAWKVIGRAQRVLQPAFAAIGEITSSVAQLLSVVPVVGPLGSAVANLWGAIFTNYLPFRVLVTAAGGWFAAPWGWVATGWAQTHGIDPAACMPLVTGVAVTGATWWAIDRRTEHLTATKPGTAVHWLTCIPTAVAGLATLLYMTPGV